MWLKGGGGGGLTVQPNVALASFCVLTTVEAGEVYNFVIIVQGNYDNIGDDNFPCGAILMITISLLMVVILWFYINLGIFTIIALEVLLLDYLMAWNL